MKIAMNGSIKKNLGSFIFNYFLHHALTNKKKLQLKI